MASTSNPTPESLNLSASLFTSSISDWIPSNFGHVIPAAEAEKDWQAILRSAGEGKDRLGLGHPLIDAPKLGVRGGGGYGRGLQGLEKSLKRGQKRVAEDEKMRNGSEAEAAGWARRGQDQEDEEEEESRASMIGNRKRIRTFDLLSIKKAKKQSQASTTRPVQSHPMEPSIPDIASISKGSPKESATADPTTPTPVVQTTQQFGIGHPVTHISPANDAEPASPSSTDTANPFPPPGKQHQPNTFGSAESIPSATTSPTRSKSALRREKRKRAKLSRQAAD